MLFDQPNINYCVCVCVCVCVHTCVCRSSNGAVQDAPCLEEREPDREGGRAVLRLLQGGVDEVSFVQITPL